PEIMRAHLAAVENQLLRQRRLMSALRGRRSVERLAAWLLDAPVTAGEGCAVIDLTFRRRDLSALLDMTVETFWRTLHQIAERGAIRLLSPDRFVIRERGLRERLAPAQDASRKGWPEERIQQQKDFGAKR